MTSVASKWMILAALAALSACSSGQRLTGVVRLAEHNSARCYLDGAGQLSCLGGPITLPDGTQTSSGAGPRVIAGMTGLTRVAMSDEAVCGLRNDGRVLCFGAGVSRWQLGDQGVLRAGIIEVNPGMGATDIAVFSGVVCAVIANGEVSCWGNTSFDGLLGRPSGAPTTGIETVSGLTSATQLAIGGGFACARLNDGTVSCWGANLHGELGDGSTMSARLPVRASGLTNVRSVTAGLSHVCAQREDGSVWCWGSNEDQQLGGAGPSRTAPAVSESLSGAREVIAVSNSTCWLTGDGNLRHSDATFSPGAFGSPTTARRLLSCGVAAGFFCVETNSGEVLCL
jgi:alpha-tubulin suppressor-like RCC1 family protein